MQNKEYIHIACGNYQRSEEVHKKLLDLNIECFISNKYDTIIFEMEEWEKLMEIVPQDVKEELEVFQVLND